MISHFYFRKEEEEEEEEENINYPMCFFLTTIFLFFSSRNDFRAQDGIENRIGIQTNK